MHGKRKGPSTRKASDGGPKKRWRVRPIGDHDMWAKQVPYQASVSVPLVVAGPGVRRGVVSDALVGGSNLDRGAGDKWF